MRNDGACARNIWNPFQPKPFLADDETNDGIIPDEETLRPERRPGPAPAALPVHVLAGSATVRCREGRLIIEYATGEPIERPLAFVSALHVHGWANVTAPCIRILLEQGTPIVWRSPGGYPVGYSAPLDQAGLEVRRTQYAAAGKPLALRIAREFVAARIENTRELVRRREFASREVLRRTLRFASNKALRARNLGELRGFEGSAVAQYFSVFDDLIGDQAGDIAFDGRSRRPPRNALNAMLSYAYAVIAGECLCAVAARASCPKSEPL